MTIYDLSVRTEINLDTEFSNRKYLYNSSTDVLTLGSIATKTENLLVTGARSNNQNVYPALRVGSEEFTENSLDDPTGTIKTVLSLPYHNAVFGSG